MSRMYQSWLSIVYWLDVIGAYTCVFGGGFFILLAGYLLIFQSEDIGLVVLSIYSLGLGVGMLWWGIRLVKEIPALKQKFIDRKSMINRIDED